jgi:hypothetical protein
MSHPITLNLGEINNKKFQFYCVKVFYEFFFYIKNMVHTIERQLIFSANKQDFLALISGELFIARKGNVMPTKKITYSFYQK